MAGIRGQLIGAQLENLTSDPSALSTGLLYYHTTNLAARIYNGTSWQYLAHNPCTTTGDIIYASSTATPSVLSRLAIGASGTVLHGGATPSYSAVSLTADVSGILPPANGGTGIANNAASTLTISGAFATTLTVTNTTGVTLPVTGTLATLAGSETLTNKTLTSPILTTPTLGVATATTINKVTITAPATGSTLTIAEGKTLTTSNTLTFTGTDSSSVAFGAGGTVAYVANKLSVFAATTSAELAGVISDETGSGALVFANTPTLVTPVLGTPTSGTLTNCTGLPLTTGITGTLGISNGGTGQTTANNALNALLPSQGGNSGKVLTTDATNTSWQSAATVPATAGLVYSTGAALASLAFSGNGNKVGGINSGGTDAELKSFAVGTSGTDFAVAHAAGTITFNLPDAGASARGAVTTGTQTFAGAKTVSSKFLVSDGSVTAPSIGFSSDDDGSGTGIYRVGANNLGFTANGTNIGQYSSSGAWTIGATGSTAAQTINGRALHIGASSTPGGEDNWGFRLADNTLTMYNGPMAGITTGASGTNCVVVIQKDSSSSRSVNAAGTLNASGADYAEYMTKEDGCEDIQKGEVCGVNAEGKLTKKFSSAHTFVVKSTNPSYVGGDNWFREKLAGESREEYTVKLQVAQKKVDRVAFSGQVPCMISGSFHVGDLVLARQLPNDGIEAVAVSRATATLDDYMNSVGRVWKIVDNKTALISVGLK